MIDLNTALMGILGLLGTALLAHLGTILYGKIGKKLFIAPFAWIASLTRNKKDDKLIEEAKQDLGILEKKEK
jgi:hypothetical protein